jgi:hypothetical protein
MKTTKFFTALVVIGALFAFLMPAARADSEQSEKTTLFAALTAMSGTSAPATLTVAASGVTYTVNVTEKTKFVRRFEASTSLAEFILGDILEIKGSFTGGSNSTTITAQWIKNYSIQRAGGTFKGEITALDCDNSKFTFDPDERPVQTVKLSALTKILRGGVQITCADLNVGEKATVIGLWRQSINQIDADRVIVKMRSVEGTISEITLTNGGLPATFKVLKGKKETWTINVTSDTALFFKHLGETTIAGFNVGDRIVAHGTVASSTTLNALTLRNLSRTKLSAKYLRTHVGCDGDTSPILMIARILRKGC